MRTAFQYHDGPHAPEEADYSGSLDEARNKCVEDFRCEVVCYHQKTGKTQLYQNFNSALKGLGGSGSRTAWKEVLQKAPAWYDKDWTCLQASPSCRRKAAKTAGKKEEAGLKDTLEGLGELRLLQQSLHQPSPPAFQTQGALSHDAANFLGLLKFPMGKQAQELREKCTDIASEVARAREVPELGPFCQGKVWVHRPIKDSMGHWQECCQDHEGFKCKDRFVIPVDHCSNCQGVCLEKGQEPGPVQPAGDDEGECLELGAPGSWSSRSGEVVELMSARAPSPPAQLLLECLGRPAVRPSRRRRRVFL